MSTFWRCGGVDLNVFDRTYVMGILNVTPDSFSDGGRFLDRDSAVEHGMRMVAEGAEIVDVGGESTRPGAEPVTVDEELSRVVPVITALAGQTNVPISIDTVKCEVAEAALEAGAVIVNDVSAMRFDPRMPKVVGTSGAGVILMHMLGEPRTMQKSPIYDDVVSDVARALFDWAAQAEAAGISSDRIAIDPGIGFGKTPEHNLALLKHLDALTDAESQGRHRYPVVVGPSRKSFIGSTLGVEVDERLEGTAAAVSWAVSRRANVIRVHDVEQMSKVVRMTEAIREAS